MEPVVTQEVKAAEVSETDFVGFGRHGELTYQALWEEQPGYCLWAIKTFQDAVRVGDEVASDYVEGESKIKRLGQWLIKKNELCEAAGTVCEYDENMELITKPGTKSLSERVAAFQSTSCSKFYAVSYPVSAVYKSWADCKAVVEGAKGAKYKSFSTEAEAHEYASQPPPVKAPSEKKKRTEKTKPKSRNAEQDEGEGGAAPRRKKVRKDAVTPNEGENMTPDASSPSDIDEREKKSVDLIQETSVCGNPSSLTATTENIAKAGSKKDIDSKKTNCTKEGEDDRTMNKGDEAARKQVKPIAKANGKAKCKAKSKAKAKARSKVNMSKQKGRATGQAKAKGRKVRANGKAAEASVTVSQQETEACEAGTIQQPEVTNVATTEFAKSSRPKKARASKAASTGVPVSEKADSAPCVLVSSESPEKGPKPKKQVRKSTGKSVINETAHELLSSDLLKRAAESGLAASLQNLAARLVSAKVTVSGEKMLEVLRATDGLVNKAKNILLGAETATVVNGEPKCERREEDAQKFTQAAQELKAFLGSATLPGNTAEQC
jgi:viroplasmin and RNaseH domain-containing protein